MGGGARRVLGVRGVRAESAPGLRSLCRAVKRARGSWAGGLGRCAVRVRRAGEWAQVEKAAQRAACEAGAGVVRVQKGCGVKARGSRGPEARGHVRGP